MKRALGILGVAAALVAGGPPAAFSAKRARKTRTAKASKKVAAARPAPRLLQMRVSSEQVYSNPVADRVYGAAEAPKENRSALAVDFQAPLVCLSADRFRVERSQVSLFGRASIVCEVAGKPLNISGEQLKLSWALNQAAASTVVEAQIMGVYTSGEMIEVPADAKPLSLSEVALPLDATPLAVLLRALQNEAIAHGRFRGGYVDGAPFSVTRYVVKFQGNSWSSDQGSYSEDGRLIYDQHKRILFLEARTDSFYGRRQLTLLQLTLADVTMARLDAVLRAGQGLISYTKTDLADALAAQGAKIIKRSFTTSTLK